MEERKGRRYKGGDLFWIWGEHSGEIFMEEQRKESDGAEREEIWRRGLTPGGRFTLREEKGCYLVYQYVGSGARKPVGFLGPAGLLVGRVEHPSWH